MNKLKIALTTGDLDGIGFEVTAKAIHKIGPQENVQFFLFRSPTASSKYLSLIERRFGNHRSSSLKEALSSEEGLVQVVSNESPAHWVEAVAKSCMKGQLHALATAPLSKVTIREAGMKDLGHTDILKRVAKTSSVHMGFVGDHFNVVLATAHLPLASVPKHLAFKVLAEALINANRLRSSLPAAQRRRPIAVLGLNPHAGEKGLIGQEELLLFPHLAEFAREQGFPIVGPLVPDAAFFRENWTKFSVYLALYHDQGLIPFKMIHGQNSGVHISLGLPFVRTSVDHGTAKDIFGKDKANPNSMIDAIRWSIKLARQKGL